MERARAVTRPNDVFHPANACGIRVHAHGCSVQAEAAQGERRVLDLRWVVANLDEAKRRLSTRGPAAAATPAAIEQPAAERKAMIQATESRPPGQKNASE